MITCSNTALFLLFIVPNLAFIHYASVNSRERIPIQVILSNGSRLPKFFPLKVNLNDVDINELRSMSIDDIVRTLEKMEEPVEDPERRKIIDSRIKENGLTDFEVRMKILGINGFTLLGFAVAFVVLALNNILGYGWMAKALGRIQDETPKYQYESKNLFKSENLEQARILRGGADVDVELIKKQMNDLQERLELGERNNK